MDRAGASHCACRLCETSADSTLAYFKRAFGEPHRFAATSEGIADALGYCSTHGAELLKHRTLRPAIAQVFERVVPRVLPLLTESRFGDERFQRVYFSTPHACPACSYQRRAVSRHATELAKRAVWPVGPDAVPQLPTMCDAHFQLMARALKPERRMSALGAHVHLLDHTRHAVEDLPRAGSPAETSRFERAALATALGLTACPAGARSAPIAMPLAEALRSCSDFEQAVVRARACPICVEVERARQRWLAAVQLAVAHRLDAWLLLPTCAEHVALAADLGDAAVTAKVAAHALRVAAEQAHHQLRALVHAAESEAEQATARIVRWGRRPRRRKSEPSHPTPPRIVRCAACERLAIAELHVTGRLLRLLQDSRQRHAFESGYGLCMKHHAQAYLLSSRGVVRSFLATDQVHRVHELMRWIKDEQDILAQDHSRSVPNAAYVLALRRFCGFA